MEKQRGTEKAFFWNSDGGDRKYNAESISEMLLPFFKPGVFTGQLEVTAPGGMKIQIAGGEETGFAWFRTKSYHNTTNLPIDISGSSGTLSRIDNVIIRKDTVLRECYALIQEGSFAQTPTAPAIIRSSTYFDLKLAEITIPVGAVEITQANIRDCRMDADVCGWVAASVSEIDFSQCMAQFETFFNEYKIEFAETYTNFTGDYSQMVETFETQQAAAFTNWFNQVKGQLSTDVAGNLLNLINNLQSSKAEKVMEDVNDATKGFSLIIVNGALCVRREK